MEGRDFFLLRPPHLPGACGTEVQQPAGPGSHRGYRGSPRGTSRSGLLSAEPPAPSPACQVSCASFRLLYALTVSGSRPSEPEFLPKIRIDRGGNSTMTMADKVN